VIRREFFPAEYNLESGIKKTVKPDEANKFDLVLD
jgi:hypothetical protein